MLPKVEAAVEFAESAPGRSALITLLEKAKDGVAGKTGTAEKNDGNDMWFVGMAPADDASIVVAVVIEDGEESEGTIKAHDILQTALEVQGLL